VFAYSRQKNFPKVSIAKIKLILIGPQMTQLIEAGF